MTIFDKMVSALKSKRIHHYIGYKEIVVYRDNHKTTYSFNKEGKICKVVCTELPEYCIGTRGMWI